MVVVADGGMSDPGWDMHPGAKMTSQAAVKRDPTVPPKSGKGR